MTPVQRERVILLTIAIIILTALALVCALAFGFFVLPVVLLVVAGALFYWALRHQGFRNPISPPDMGLSGQWADGQPLGRAMEHVTQQHAAHAAEERDRREAEEHRKREDEEREEMLRHTDPRDFQGPPPVNPFP